MDEIRKVLAMARHMDAKGIAEELGRTPRSVDSMVYRLGLSMKDLRAWTSAEDETLRRFSGVLTIARLAKRLRRTPDTVKRRALALGISLQKRGQHHHAAKHPDTKRQEYRELRAAGTAQQTAARMVGVAPATARRWEAP
jgi:sugar phosphate isomerase/epimerase